MVLQQDLPPEILAYVFMHCLHDEPIKIPPRSPRSEPPWSLSQVCSRWRSIAHGHGQLWTNLWISSLMPITHNKVRHVLSRSGNLSISLVAHWTFVLNLSLDHYTRVHSLTIINAQRVVLSRLVLFNVLESLHLDYPDLRTIASSPLAQVHLPASLRVLHLTCSSGDVLPFHMLGFIQDSGPWANLTDISISPGTSIRLLEVLQILQQSRELVKCNIILERIYPNEAYWDEKPIIVPKLRSLAVQHDHYMLGPLLDLLTLPSLTDLEISTPSALRWPQAAILRLIQRSQCHMIRFVGGKNVESLIEAIPLMRAMPGLITLHLEVSEPASSQFFNDCDAEDLVPDLKELCIEVDSAGALLKFLESRWTRGPGQGICRGIIYIKRENLAAEEVAMERLEDAMIGMGTEMSVQLLNPFN